MLRNALLPTITVVATQLGYMIGGLVVVETLFRYQGIGSLILNAARGKDFPMLEAGVLTVGASIVLATLRADMLYTALDPRLRDGAAGERAPRTRALVLRSGAFLPAAASCCCGSFCALFGPSLAPYDPYRDDLLTRSAAALRRALVRHRPDRARHLVPRDRRRAADPGDGAAGHADRDRRSAPRWAC